MEGEIILYSSLSYFVLAYRYSRDLEEDLLRQIHHLLLR